MDCCHASTSQILTLILFGLKEIMLCGLGACKLNSIIFSMKEIMFCFLCVLNIIIKKKIMLQIISSSKELIENMT